MQPRVVTATTCAPLEDGVYRGEGYCGTVQTMTRTVLVDGNNVMGSRPDGWWRNRAGAAQRLVADIVPVARSLGGTWTVVFDGAEPPLIPPQERVSVVHTHRDPLRSVGSARLRDIDLATGRIDPHPEAGELPIPEYGVLLDLELLDGAVRERSICKRRHVQSVLCSRSLGNPPPEMSADAVAHTRRRRLLRAAHQVRVPRRRVDPHANPTV